MMRKDYNVGLNLKVLAIQIRLYRCFTDAVRSLTGTITVTPRWRR